MQTILRGRCGSCGKAYRIPDAEHHYRCKVCDGTVRAADDDPQPLPEDEGAEHLVHGALVDAHGARERRAIIDAQRRATSRRNKLLWGAFLFVVAGGLVAVRALRPGPVYAGGVPRDLDQAGLEVVARWNGADVGALAALFHPAATDLFRERLERVVESRGWTQGFPEARTAGAQLVEGTRADPQKATTLLEFGDDGAQALLSWQFEPLHERWYAYQLELTPPPLAPYVERFRAAWSSASPEALEPLFLSEYAGKLITLIERKAAREKWDPSFPELGEARMTGDERLLRAAERAAAAPVESAFPIEGGDLVVRWRFRFEPDTWYVSSIRFPKK